MTNIDKNSWAYWYDVINTKERNDYQFYARQLNKNDLALEIACGTGRIYLKMLNDGYSVHGVDISQNMLKKLRENSEQQDIETQELFHQDASSMDLDYNYDLIYYPFNSIAHINRNVNNQLKTFENIYSHLKENGKFAFDIYVMNFDTISNYGKLESKEFTNNSENYRFETWAEMVSKTEQTIKSYNRIINLDTNKIEWQTSHKLSLYPKQQLELLLNSAGFRDYKFYDGFTEEPIKDNSEHMGIVANK